MEHGLNTEKMQSKLHPCFIRVDPWLRWLDGVDPWLRNSHTPRWLAAIEFLKNGFVLFGFGQVSFLIEGLGQVEVGLLVARVEVDDRFKDGNG
jgi:hypothetical protein